MFEGGEMKDVTKMSSKGQIVIPWKIRKKINLKHGDIFVIRITYKDKMLLEKLE